MVVLFLFKLSFQQGYHSTPQRTEHHIFALRISNKELGNPTTTNLTTSKWRNIQRLLAARFKIRGCLVARLVGCEAFELPGPATGEAAGHWPGLFVGKPSLGGGKGHFEASLKPKECSLSDSGWTPPKWWFCFLVLQLLKDRKEGYPHKQKNSQLAGHCFGSPSASLLVSDFAFGRKSKGIDCVSVWGQAISTRPRLYHFVNLVVGYARVPRIERRSRP